MSAPKDAMRSNEPGLAGDLGRIQSFGHLVNLLRAHFAPRSQFIAPSAAFTQSGGRKVAVASKQRLTDSTILALVSTSRNGTPQSQVTWAFSTKFPSPPTVTFSPEGAPKDGTNPFLFIQTDGNAPSQTSVTICSSEPTDTRKVHMQAVLES